MRDFLTYGHNMFDETPPVAGGIWNGFRSEGRFSINIASGLAETGLKVDVNSSWKRWPTQNVTENLRLINNRAEAYRHVLSFGSWNFLSRAVADTYWVMFYSNPDVKHIEQEIDKHGIDMDRVKFCMPYKPIYDKNVNDFRYELYYFPTVFPLPIYSKGFQPHTIDFSKHRIRLHLQTGIFNEFTPHYPRLASDICQCFNELGYEVDLFLQTKCGRQFLETEDFYGWKGQVHFVRPLLNYYDLYQFITACDFGIMFLEPPAAAGSQFDFISLGKPILSFMEGHYTSDNSVSPLMQNGDLIYSYEKPANKESLFEYVKNGLENAESMLLQLQESMRDYEYETWKSIVLPLLED